MRAWRDGGRAGVADAAMTPFLTMTVWSAFGGAPVPSMTRACVNATTGASTATKARVAGDSVGACADRAATDATTAKPVMNRRIIGALPSA